MHIHTHIKASLVIKAKTDCGAVVIVNVSVHDLKVFVSLRPETGCQPEVIPTQT